MIHSIETVSSQLFSVKGGRRELESHVRKYRSLLAAASFSGEIGGRSSGLIRERIYSLKDSICEREATCGKSSRGAPIDFR
jgi:hypothetical protein